MQSQYASQAPSFSPYIPIFRKCVHLPFIFRFSLTGMQGIKSKQTEKKKGEMKLYILRQGRVHIYIKGGFSPCPFSRLQTTNAAHLLWLKKRKCHSFTCHTRSPFHSGELFFFPKSPELLLLNAFCKNKCVSRNPCPTLPSPL